MRLLSFLVLLLGVSCIQIKRTSVSLHARDAVALDSEEILKSKYVDNSKAQCASNFDQMKELSGDRAYRCDFYHCAIPNYNAFYNAELLPVDKGGNPLDCDPIVTVRECPHDLPACPAEDWGEECDLPWPEEWEPCSMTCGGGVQYRHRVLPDNCKGCRFCDTQGRPCNTQPCGVDCKLGDWEQWSECDVSCLPNYPVAFSQKRYRNIIQGVEPGKLCPDTAYFETRQCDPRPPSCAVDCEVSPWVKGECSVTCGCGVLTYTREILREADHGGAPCPSLSYQESCTCAPCPQECVWSDWFYGPCSGDCYELDANGGKVFPKRRKTRQVLQFASPDQTQCAVTTCNTVKIEPCENVPQCVGECQVGEWEDWVGECPECVPYGSPVPVLKRSRKIIKNGDGICPCTQEEQTCDSQWCKVNCIPSDWSGWGPCLPNLDEKCEGKNSIAGKQYRERQRARPANYWGDDCPNLKEDQPCEICCRRDCEVNKWLPWTTTVSGIDCAKARYDNDGKLVPVLQDGVPVAFECGEGKGIVKYTRTVKTQPSPCGIQCPETEVWRECEAASPCCKVDCVPGEDQISECYGCGHNAVQFRKHTIAVQQECGGTPCCIEWGTCSLFNPEPCPNPPACPQIPCTYSEWGNFSGCPLSCTPKGQDATESCRWRYPVAGTTDEKCVPERQCEKCNDICCPVDCAVGEFGEWGDWAPACGHQVRQRSRGVTVNPSCHGSPCPPLLQHDTRFKDCPVNCVVEEWGSWSLCPSCRVAGDETKYTRKKFRAILVQPAHNGDECPEPLEDEEECKLEDCDVNCVMYEWGDWEEGKDGCNVDCGDGFRTRRRSPQTLPKGKYGMPCPQMVDQEFCHIDCPNCIIGPPEYDGECDLSCIPLGSGLESKRRMKRKMDSLKVDGTALEFCPVSDQTWTEVCNVPCCPVDCQVSGWHDWSDCIDGMKTRTRDYLVYPDCGGASCPSCMIEHDVCKSPVIPGECEFGEACEEGWD